MGKFFLPQNTNERKNKKRTDYKIIIYKQLLQFVKAKHLKSVSNVVKQIKQAKLNQKSYTQFQAKLNQLKTIKKNQIKQITLYIMNHQLEINNLNILQKLVGFIIDEEKIKHQLQSSSPYKAFIQKLISSNGFKSKKEKIDDLRQEIMKKKQIVKEKSKQRKIKKLLIRQHKNSKINKPQNRKKQFEQTSKEDQYMNNEQALFNKVELNQHYQQKESNVQKHENKNSFWSRNNKKIEQLKKQREAANIKSQRTEFIKKGRNKIKQQKKLKKQSYRKKQEKPQIKKQEKQAPKQAKIHPSWAAKQQQKKNCVITAFAGKKTLL